MEAGLQYREHVYKPFVWVLCVALLCSCALPHFQPDKPAIQKPVLGQESLVTSDSQHLPLYQWLPAKQSPKAVIIALHGFNDYGLAFKESGEYFAEKGVALLSYDQRGFGRTAQWGIWGGRENLIHDLSEMVEAAHLKFPDAPIYLLGESMGAAVAITALTTPDFPADQVEGIILSAPALWGEDTLNPMYRFLLWSTAHSFPQVKVTGRGLKIRASDNIEMLKALGRDPLVIKKTRIDALYGLVQMMDEGQRNIAQLRKPMLFLYGKHDQVIPPVAIAAALKRITQPYQFVYYKDGWHMLLRDLQAKRVRDDILSWIENPENPLPSGEIASAAELILPSRKSARCRQKQWPCQNSYGRLAVINKNND